MKREWYMQTFWPNDICMRKETEIHANILATQYLCGKIYVSFHLSNLQVFYVQYHLKSRHLCSRHHLEGLLFDYSHIYLGIIFIHLGVLSGFKFRSQSISIGDQYLRIQSQGLWKSLFKKVLCCTQITGSICLVICLILLIVFLIIYSCIYQCFKGHTNVSFYCFS